MDTRASRPPNNATRLAAVEAQLESLTLELGKRDALAADLRAGVEREQRGIDARLLQLEGQKPPPGPPPEKKPWYARFPWEKVPPWLQAIATPLMVALIGYWLTGSLDLAIKQQQADISGVKEMREALADLYAAEPEKAKVDTAALSMAAFGGVAAGPLLEAYNLGGAARPEAAERGLIAAATRDKVRVCEALAAVKATTGTLYSADTRSFAAKLQGDLGC
jgi:hypothetical protein